MIDFVFVFFSQNNFPAVTKTGFFSFKIVLYKEKHRQTNLCLILPVPFIILLISQIYWVCKNYSVVVKTKIIVSPIYSVDFLRCKFRKPAVREDFQKNGLRTPY